MTPEIPTRSAFDKTFGTVVYVMTKCNAWWPKSLFSESEDGKWEITLYDPMTQEPVVHPAPVSWDQAKKMDDSKELTNLRAWCVPDTQGDPVLTFGQVACGALHCRSRRMAEVLHGWRQD